MNSKSLLALLAALIIIPATAVAQDATTSTRTIDSSTDDQLTRGGTGTGTRTDAATESSTRVINSSTDDQLTRGGTGTGTRTLQATAPVEASMAVAAPSPWTLQAKSGSVTSPGTNTITLILPGDPAAASGATATYTVALSSSDGACAVPAAAELTWVAATGGSSVFVVDCAAVPSDRNVTITAGTATASFDLLAAAAAN